MKRERKFKNPRLAFDHGQRIRSLTKLEGELLRLVAILYLNQQFVSILSKPIKLSFPLATVHPDSRSQLAQAIHRFFHQKWIGDNARSGLKIPLPTGTSHQLSGLSTVSNGQPLHLVCRKT